MPTNSKEMQRVEQIDPSVRQHRKNKSNQIECKMSELVISHTELRRELGVESPDSPLSHETIDVVRITFHKLLNLL